MHPKEQTMLHTMSHACEPKQALKAFRAQNTRENKKHSKRRMTNLFNTRTDRTACSFQPVAMFAQFAHHKGCHLHRSTNKNKAKIFKLGAAEPDRIPGHAPTSGWFEMVKRSLRTSSHSRNSITIHSWFGSVSGEILTTGP
eukprot:6299236-Amphidinium_carterae.1